MGLLITELGSVGWTWGPETVEVSWLGPMGHWQGQGRSGCHPLDTDGAGWQAQG